MNIDEIPTEHLNRGIVVSIMESEKPFIETFTDGNGLAPVVFLRGVPMPYSVFVLYVAMRFAPERTKGQMPKLYENGIFRLPAEEQLRAFWERVEMPTEMRSRLSGYSYRGGAIQELIRELYVAHTKSDAEESKKSFREFIHRIEQDYESSLIDPVKV